MAYPTPPPRDPASPDPRAQQSRSISASFRPGSTIDDLMARLNSPNPNPAPPTISSPFSPSVGLGATGNGSAMSPPPGGQVGGYPPSLYSPAIGLAGMISPTSRGGPSPFYGGMNGTPGPGTPGAGNENRQSQLLDLLRNAGQSPANLSTNHQQSSPSNMYQPFGIGQPPQLNQQQSFSHPHPAMQQNNSFSGPPSTGLNRVVSPTYGLSAGAGTNQAQNLLAALMNGSSTPVPSAPPQEMPFAIHQPVIMDEQVPIATMAAATHPPTSDVQSSTVDQSNGLARADTFGNPSKDAVNINADDAKSHSSASKDQTSATEVSETSKTAEREPVIPPSVAAPKPAAPSNGAATETSVPKPFFSTFVSPFDAFDAPPSLPAAGTVGAGTKKKNKKDKSVKDVPKAVVTATPVAKHADDAGAKLAAENKSNKADGAQTLKSANETAPIASASSVTASLPKKTVKQEDIPVVYRASAFVDPSQTTTAATIPSADYMFDMSEPHIDSLVHVSKPFEERRVSNIKTHVMTTGLGAGSVLKAAVNLLAYMLPKGKARIVNQDTAENTLVTLQASDSSPPITVVDLAVTDEWVVLLGHDGSFGIWRVDTGAEGRSLNCKRAFFCGAKVGSPVAQRVELFQSDDSTSLIVMTSDAVFSGEVNALTQNSGESDFAQVMEVKYEASHPNLVDLDISLEKKEVAVITRTGHFFVYALGTAQPVAQGVHHPADGTWTTSVRIINENLLIGSSQGEFSLVAMQSPQSGATSNVLSRLTFKDHGVTIDPQRALWMKPRFDAKEQLLWIVSFSRASIFVIKYREPRIPSGSSSGRRRAFRKMLEFPLEPLGDFTLDPCDSASFFYKDPKGFSQASVRKHLLDLLEESAEEDADEPEETRAQAERVPEVQAVEQEPIQHLSPQDTDLWDSGRALDAIAAEAIQQDAQPSQSIEPVTVSQDLASNKPGSGLSDVDIARQRTEIHAQPSNANTGTINVPSGISSADLDRLQISITQQVQQFIAMQLTSFSKSQLSEIKAIRQDLVSQEAGRQQTFVNIIRDVIGQDVKDILHRIVSDQFEEKLVPLVVDTLRQQTANAFSSEIPAQINSALQDTVLSQVERSLIPHLGRTFTSTLSPIVERNVRALISDSLVPKFMDSIDNISDELSNAVHREMLEVRKDVLVEQSSQLKAAEAMIESMAGSMKMLISQVKDLSEQVKEMKSMQVRSQALAPPPTAVVPPSVSQLFGAPPLPAGMPTPQTMPPMPQQTPQIVAPRPMATAAPPPPAVTNIPSPLAVRPNPVMVNAEEEFLNALMTMGDNELVKFVLSRTNRIQDYLPAPGQYPCPLSQQVLLTMIHRLSKAVAPLPTASNEYQILLQWIMRSAYLIDGKAHDIQDFIGPVRTALASDYQTLIARYAQQQDRTPATVQAVQMMNQVLQVLGSR